MQAATVLTAALIGIAYSSWPVVGKYVQVGGGWVAVIVISGTALPMLLLSASQISTDSVPNWRAMMLLFLFAVLNGVAQFMHSQRAADPLIQIGVFSMIVYVVMVAGSPLWDRIWNGTHLSYYQIAAIPLALAVVYLAGK